MNNIKKIIIACASMFAIASADVGTELTPLVGLDFTCHRCFTDDVKGLNTNFELGAEGLITLGNNFGAGIQAKTSIGYDLYTTDVREGTLMDEYFPVTASVGPVFYIGETWYLAGAVTKVITTIGHDTWISGDNEDTDVKNLKYEIDNFDYVLETGFRVNFHNAIYVKVNTNLISSYTIDKSKYNVYIGWRYFI